MKRKLFTALALLLCVSLCLILTPGAFAEGEDAFSVHFYNEKGYDLVGLKVLDADGSEIAPAGTDEGYTYLLTPGAYSYAYHDDRGIFQDIEETGFSVVSDALEIPVTLTAGFAGNYYSIWNSAPLSEGGDDEATIRAAMPTREEVLDGLTEMLLAKADEEESGFSLSDSDVFNSTPGEISSAALQVRNAMINRQPEVTVSFSSAVEWSQGDIYNAYYDALSAAVAHTGNHWEGDTIKKVLSSTGGSIGSAYDGSVYNYQITFTLLYKTDYTQETAVINAVSNLVSSLGLESMSDYEKVSTIHEWLYNNVNYDWEHSSDPTYEIQFTDYAALIGRKAVCQGIATAYYRLCLASGVDARYVSSKVLNHGWNIVNIGGKYYEADATWDSNIREKQYADPLPSYFLRGTEWWLTGHTNESGYSTIGDEFDTSSYTLYDSTVLDFYFLQAQYPVFETYVVSGSDFDPLTAGVAVSAVNFPDAAFRAYVSGNFDTDESGYLDDAEIAAVTEINVRGKNEEGAQLISTLKGIEYFPSLLHLDCAGNSLTELDVSKNTALKTLTCGIMDNDGNVFGNQLSKLDVSKNTALEYLYCTHNQISSLDVSNHTALDTLFCYNNDMTQLNISGCTSLTTLSCGNNRLTHLDVSGNTTLESLYCYNNNLSTLTVKNHPSLTFLQCSANSSLDTLDVSGCAELSSLYCQNCGLSILNVTGCTRLTQVGCANNSLSTLDFSTCANLSDLGCQDNALVSLNLTECSQLSGLGCRNNQLAALDLSSCGNLHGLICNGNPMTSVDITPCPILVLTRYAAEPVVNEGIITYFDDQFGNVISCDETDDILIYALLELPADVTEIEEEAFSDGAFIYVKLAEGTTSVGPRAFADCPNLFIIYVPAQTEIDPTAFDGSYNAYIYRAGADEIVPALQYES